MELELLTVMNALTMDMMSTIDWFYITLQFELTKTMSSYIIWIPILIGDYLDVQPSCPTPMMTMKTFNYDNIIYLIYFLIF